jgi:5-methylcytosine-specific restriction protein A
MPLAPGTHYITPPPTDAEKRQSKVERWQRDDERRGSKHERGYDSAWDKASKGYRARHPLCCCCQANGFVTAVAVVDHIEPHKGDRSLFWKRDNWQGLCWDCHRRIKSVLEQRYSLGQIDAVDLRLDRELPEFFIRVL